MVSGLSNTGRIGGGDHARLGTFWVYLLLLAVYAAGLTHGVAKPWTGMHDWNGAFFSQLARNSLRYPISVHHGLPLVAVGQAVPPAEERSIYATHPPGLVWLVASAFWLSDGSAEWAARLVPILFSLGTLGVLIWLVRRRLGDQVAVCSGLVYAVMPMPVYFGRMVNHESVCLFLMLGALAAWTVAADQDAGCGRRRWARAWWVLAVVGGIWVDWSGLLFAGLLAVGALVEWRRGRLDRVTLAWAWGVPILAGGVMLFYLVYAGLEGRWGDLVAIFLSRATEAEGGVLLRDAAARGGVWRYILENLSWPVVVLSGVGVIQLAVRWWPRRLVVSQASPGVAATAVGGWWLVPATGLLWLLIFRRQFERHNYWMFYLGPAAAVLSGYVLISLGDWLRPRSARLAGGGLFLGLAAVVGFSLPGTDDYFARISYPSGEVAAWKAIRGLTETGDRLLLFRNPVRVERRGGYVFRNLVPPHQAFYLDRAFDVQTGLDAVVGQAGRYAGFVIPISDAIRHRRGLEPVRRRFPEVAVANKVFFDLRARSGEEGRAGAGVGP